MLTIRGAFLDTGISRKVTIGNVPCKIQRWVWLIYLPWLSLQAFCQLLFSHLDEVGENLEGAFFFFLRNYCDTRLLVIL